MLKLMKICFQTDFSSVLLVYDDRLEDCKPPAAGDVIQPPGKDWVPGQVANHKSITAFQRELSDKGIEISSSKIRKILITGGCWSTERSREIGLLFDKYTKHVSDYGLGLNSDQAIVKIAEELGVSIVTVSVNLPYQSVVYNLENKSSNAKRCAKYREGKSKGYSLSIHTTQANTRQFVGGDLAAVPTQAYTMGIGYIKKSTTVILMDTGAGKRGIVEKAFCGPVTPKAPASILQVHPNVVVIGDEAAISDAVVAAAK